MVSPRSPCLKNTSNTISRQRHQVPTTLSHYPSNDNEKPSSFVEESRDHCSNISIMPIVHQHSRSHFTPTHTLTRQHRPDADVDDVGTRNASLVQTSCSRIPVDLRKKIHGIYVLPVSPALSSSSSTTNTDEAIKSGSNTMPIRFLRHVSSSINVHNDSACRGVKNDSYADSPLPKDRTLPRSHAGTLRRIQPPSQPPPLPPIMSQIDTNDARPSVDCNNDKSSIQHHSATTNLNPDTINLRLNNQQVCSKIQENQLKKASPPPVPCRSQKPIILPIGFERLTTTVQPDDIGFRVAVELSPQDDYSEHIWPKPPESMTTSEISGAPQPLAPSIPYDRLHHDHLIPTVLMRHDGATNYFEHHRFGEHRLLTESET